MHAVVVGGGAIGLSVAWHLLPHARVTVVDVPHPGAASPASAGMLAPFAEAKAPGPILDLGVASLRMWPSFAAELGVKLHGPGMLRLGANDAIVQWARANGFVAEVMGDGVFTPDEKNVDPPELLAALRPRLRIVHEPVEGDITVIAKGAWSAPWSFPVRGQLIALKSDAIDMTIYAPGTYLIPRNGRVIVGATEEHVGFELGTPAAAELHERAAALVPALRDAEMVDAWCGFRPGSHDGLPYIGKVDESTYVATGHYRNGILLAPITGKLLAELIVTGKTPELLEPCDPLR
ncbi:MAG TPA: FAD-dependent oxidoreductase [Thermoanaerobaculia bacterium]|nr:FAD-dependent oxidoreductase [Thermoanaerobaculia bacterium]